MIFGLHWDVHPRSREILSRFGGRHFEGHERNGNGKDKKKEIPVWEKEDYGLINTATRQIILGYSMHFESLLNILKRIPFPPPLIERLLQGFEREANDLLKELNPLIKKHQVPFG